ncbi:type II toxin-antitoxin system RelE/ParE family toxin [Cronobacter turicensis]|uniref:type II toxin-antitoxin system RelE/ParE family toxin n=1 Tax=Cronobacter turicensis TaxID=413502 RepID=UPI0024C3BECE|nr:type II toxin-antitoxin system RelE/ParE family toxin [Cronobacter turicensis]MDK1229147.1 type II toxin-antitoxin system RelE/ParE family toxin [Cronobacter turicensis]
MIRSFRHKGLQRYFETGSTAGIHARHARKLSLRLAVLNQAIRPADVDLPGFFLHSLTGERKGIWAVTVSGNWRITFAFRDGDVFIVNYEDYH